MLSSARLFKQFIIAFLFLAIIGGGAFVISQKLNPPTPTPTPDPRDVLEPVLILETNLFTVGENDYDFLAKVQNPNPTYGSSKVTYELTLLDADNQEIARKVNNFYILPGQTKYVIDTPLRFNTTVDSAVMSITGIQWQELDPLALQGIDFVVVNSEFSKTTRTAVSGIARGLVNNISDFDVARVDVVVVLFDEDGNPIGTNRSEIRTFLAHTLRGFETAWYAPIKGIVSQVYAEANTNIFENDTFIRTYGGQERFQEY